MIEAHSCPHSLLRTVVPGQLQSKPQLCHSVAARPLPPQSNVQAPLLMLGALLQLVTRTPLLRCLVLSEE